MTTESIPVRVLLLDDDAPFSKDLREAALRLNLSIESASSVGEAHQRLAHSRFEVAVVPARMAGTNGVRLISRLCRHRPDVTFVLITALRSPSLVHVAASCGARALLLKPITPDNLAKAIRSAYEEQTRYADEPLCAWDTPALRTRLADIYVQTGLVMSLATPSGTLLRTIGQRNGLCGLIRSTPLHLTTICQTVTSAMSAELAVQRRPVADLCDAGMQRVVVPILCHGELVGQVTGCGVATEPDEPDPELLTVQLGIDSVRAQKLVGRVHRTTLPEVMQTIEALVAHVTTETRLSDLAEAVGG